MFYAVVKILVRLAMHWYAGSLKLINAHKADYSKPSLIISNHPNSFFDALIISIHSPKPLHFLVRGDMFRKPWADKALRSLNMIPIFRKRDDKSFAAKNAQLFNDYSALLKNGAHIIIFPEGNSHNQWHLQPLRKGGSVRLIEQCADNNVWINIQPYTITYNSFREMPKAVHLRAVKPLAAKDYYQNGVLNTAMLVDAMQQRLSANMYGPETTALKRSFAERALLFVPAVVGYITQYWFYKLWKNFVARKTEGTIFFDSVLFGVLFFTYPLFVLIASLIIGGFTGYRCGLAAFVLLPFTSYCLSRFQHITVEKPVDS